MDMGVAAHSSSTHHSKVTIAFTSRVVVVRGYHGAVHVRLPNERTWKLQDTSESACHSLSVNPYYWAVQGSDLFADLVITLSPIGEDTNLQMTTKTKSGALAMLMLGAT